MQPVAACCRKRLVVNVGIEAVDGWWLGITATQLTSTIAPPEWGREWASLGKWFRIGVEKNNLVSDQKLKVFSPGSWKRLFHLHSPAQPVPTWTSSSSSSWQLWGTVKRHVLFQRRLLRNEQTHFPRLNCTADTVTVAITMNWPKQ